MPPLARLLLNDLTLPAKRRIVHDDGALLRKMDDIHCFECSEILTAAQEILEHEGKTTEEFREEFRHIIRKCFLPAPKTWIEFEIGDHRVGWLLIEAGLKCDVYLAQVGRCNNACPLTYDGKIELPNVAGDSAGFDITEPTPNLETTLRQKGIMGKLEDHMMPKYAQEYFFILLIILLAFINTPRIIGRKQHMPHRGLERDLVRAMKPVGKFPLHAWTEIKLDITAPQDMSGDPSIEAHYTGQRALHFCRAHLRIRLGQLEIVRAHWRGDASIGIKQSRYKIIDRSTHEPPPLP